jgi:hypothetical protein
LLSAAYERAIVLRLAFIALLAAQALLGDSADFCEQKLPESLKRLLISGFPGFRPTRLTDQARDATEVNRRSGGDGCMMVAEGDFDGDGQKDVALLLTNPRSNAVRLVVALRRAASWVIYSLPTWCGRVSTCYVQTAKPGLFRRSEALAAPLSSPDERDQIESRTESVVSGTVEATGIVYVYSKGKWLYVWVSD